MSSTQELTRNEKISAAVVVGIVAVLAYSCSVGGGSDEKLGGAADQGTVSTSTTSAVPVVGTGTSPTSTTSATTTETTEDLPDCDKQHGKVKRWEYVEGEGSKQVCLSDRDRDGLADEKDEKPDLNNDEDADGDGHSNGLDDYPHDSSRYSEFKETYTPEEPDSGGSGGSCGPGDIDGDGDGICNES
ncbi:hypothetical protein [Actinopolyspora saharensis]|uniref:hypothetical protein n=1 Tax=Actinopolyspora saharensis TaxID=995062 RepID=UPI003F681E72